MSLSHAILTALLDADLTGYELAKEFDVSLGFFWRASHQQIYQNLKKLHKEALVDVQEIHQQGKPDKRIYSLTQAGRDELEHWVRSESKVGTRKDELFIKLYNLGFTEADVLLAEVAKRKALHERRLALYRKIEERHYQDPKNLSSHKKGIYLALAAGIRQEISSLAWCDEATELIQTC